MFNFNSTTQIVHTDRNEVYRFSGISFQNTIAYIEFTSFARAHRVNLRVPILALNEFSQIISQRGFQIA